MSDEVLNTLLPALEIAAFERRPDGSFTSVAPPPGWFRRLTSDATFPFLGHILEEANEFWNSRAAGRQEWGPCAEVDEAGREFHYKVTAATVENAQYLLFQLDPGSDWIRGVLQKVREQALAAEQDPAPPSVLATMRQDVHRTFDEIRTLLQGLTAATSSADRATLGQKLTEKCDALIEGVDTLLRSSARAPERIPRQP